MRQIYILTIVLIFNFFSISAQTTSEIANNDNVNNHLSEKISGTQTKQLARNVDINISPNPSRSFIQISGLENSEYYRIYNILGKEIAKGYVSNNETINIQNLKNGLYLLKVNNMHSKKFLKE